MSIKDQSLYTALHRTAMRYAATSTEPGENLRMFQRPTMTTMPGPSTRPFVDHGGQPSTYNTIWDGVILGLVALVAVGRLVEPL
jgi:hypothetical protein